LHDTLERPVVLPQSVEELADAVIAASRAGIIWWQPLGSGLPVMYGELLDEQFEVRPLHDTLVITGMAGTSVTVPFDGDARMYLREAINDRPFKRKREDSVEAGTLAVQLELLIPAA
jgi:hypothetical protein